MEKYKEVERSIITTYRKEIWSKFVRAISNYDLIKEGDKVMVCLSGGKDSFLLAKCIQELVRHGKLKFEAKKNGLSVSGYIRMIVIQRLNEESAN